MKPAAGSAELAAKLVSLGSDRQSLYEWPAFEMAAPEDCASVRSRLFEAALSGAMIVVVSPSAVDTMRTYIESWPCPVKFAAVGEGTAKKLLSVWGEVHSVLYPAGHVSESGSERLFEMLKAASEGFPKRVVIARGQTGREYLREHLVEAGVPVEVIVVYRRIPFKAEAADKGWTTAEKPPVIYLTSTDSVEVLLANLTDEEAERVKGASVLTIHPRILAHLKETGFEDSVLIDPKDAAERILCLQKAL